MEYGLERVSSRIYCSRTTRVSRKAKEDLYYPLETYSESLAYNLIEILPENLFLEQVLPESLYFAQVERVWIGHLERIRSRGAPSAARPGGRGPRRADEAKVQGPEEGGDTSR